MKRTTQQPARRRIALTAVGIPVTLGLILSGCASDEQSGASGQEERVDASLYDQAVAKAEDLAGDAEMDPSLEFIGVNGPLRVNSPLAARTAAAMGLGFVILPSYLADPLVAKGELVPVLIDYLPTGQTLQAVYPHRRHLAGKVRALIDHLVDWFQSHPIS